MGFFDFLLSKLKIQKKLPEGKFLSSNRSGKQEDKRNGRNFNDEIKLGFSPKIKTLDFAIEQYINGLLYHHQKGEFYSSYKVLTNLCSMDSSKPGKNKKKEELLLKRINDDEKCCYINQPSANGGVCYRHVVHGEPVKEDYRLYLSCKRENIASLANALMDEFGDTNYYFKFCTDEHAASIARSEQFVFFVDNNPESLNRLLRGIDNTRRMHPELFKGSENMNPFMKDFLGYIGYAPEVEGKFTNLRGEKIPISQSYNSLLSQALEDSFLHSVREVVSRDEALSIKVNGEKLYTAKAYVKSVLSDIIKRPEMLEKLVKSMKQDLRTLSVLNPELQINGIELERDKKKSKDKQIEYDD